MNIQELPDEMLLKIFSYLPSYESVSLVDKRFYNVMCTLRDSKVSLSLDSSLFDQRRNHQLSSIEETNRGIKNIAVDFTGPIEQLAYESMMTSVIRIIKKFSETINYLSVQGNLKRSDFLAILSLVPEAVHLVFKNVRSLCVNDIDQPSQKKCHIMTTDEDLMLFQLKTLEFQDCNDEFVIVFNRLPSGVLEELSLDHRNLDELKVLFMRQVNMKKLAITWHANGSPIPRAAADILDNQKLESIEWRFHKFHYSNIETILSKQSNLKSLRLIDGVVGEVIMNVVADKLTGLESLSLYLPETPIGAFKNISKLKNLKELALQSDSDRNVTPHLVELAKLDNSSVTTLNIQYAYYISDELIAALVLSVPNLKILRFNCYYKFNIFHAIMRSFDFVEILELDPTDVSHSCDDDDDAMLIQCGCNNPNLVELSITYLLPYNTGFLEKLIADYPNLKKLAFQSMTPLTSLQFQLILDGFTKLESLSCLGGASELDKNDLNYLTEHGNHLKFISLMDLRRIKFKPRMEKRLRKIFDVIKYSYSDGLNMAVDRKTMKAEAIC